MKENVARYKRLNTFKRLINDKDSSMQINVEQW